MPATRYPGAVWRPTGDEGAMTGLRGGSLHEAVTRQEESIFGWAQTAHPCHWYVGRHGNCEQYIEVGRKAAGVKDGNDDVLTVETWDGLDVTTERDVDGRGPNQTVWTPQQCERIADLIAWLKLEHGVPIRLMKSSARSERGWAPHRWGIDPWRAPGGEVWTKARGKQCPGDLRIAQIPAILARAADLAGVEGYRPIGPGRITSTPPASFGAATLQEDDDMPTLDEIRQAIREEVTDAIRREAQKENYPDGVLIPAVRKQVNQGVAEIAQAFGFAGSADPQRLSGAIADAVVAAGTEQTREQVEEIVSAALRDAAAGVSK